jgi:GMP synthase (glutamine-hydrolysing)
MILDKVLVLDFGGQYSHLIARRIRENNVYSEIVSHDVSSDELKRLTTRESIKGVVLSGGPQSVFGVEAPKIDPRIMDLGLPVLGICYGHQLMAHAAGGLVKPAARREFGVAFAHIDNPDMLLRGLSSREKVWMSHTDIVLRLPNDFEVLAHTENCPVAAYRHKNRPLYGLQWHPEVAHTENGKRMLRNFLFEICDCQADWVISDFISVAIEETQRLIGDARAIVALSGGIDSSTATALAEKALGRNLTAVFVDHGFMRMGEPEFVRSTFQKLDLRFECVAAEQRFMRRLSGVVDPERKRRIVGEEFVRVFEEKAKEVGADYLIQGTIYPDRIESGQSDFSDKIKTHHNVAGLPTKMEFKAIVEPLRDLYKDEVREVAEKLGLPERIVERQPFPGPGLAVRIVGPITENKVEVVRKGDKIVSEEIEKAGLQNDLWQYFAVLTDTKSTGVKGDARAYGFTMAVRIVESREAMTASFAKIPYEVLQRISSRITNEIPEVTRVVYDITHKPPATIEWE